MDKIQPSNSFQEEPKDQAEPKTEKKLVNKDIDEKDVEAAANQIDNNEKSKTLAALEV